MIARVILPLFALSTLCQAAPVEEGVNLFTTQLFQEQGHEEGNLVAAPFTFSTAFALPYLGARGGTQAQMKSVLHYPDVNPERLLSGFNSVIEGVASKEGYLLSLATAAWVQNDTKFLPAFQGLLAGARFSEIKSIDFSNPDRAIGTINAWTSEKTEGKIEKLLEPAAVEASTRMVVTSALYFKGEWEFPFDPKQTRDQPFRLNGGNITSVSMMHQIHSFPYIKQKKFAAVALPYRGSGNGEVALYLVLPDHDVDLHQVAQQISLESFREMNEKVVDLVVPRFQIAAHFSAKEALEAMGMRIPFSFDADFSGVDGSRDLFISKVVQAARIEVDEVGSEAAAASAVVVGLKSYLPPKPEVSFIVNRPFFFLLVEKKAGVILFVGRVMTPEFKQRTNNK